MSETNVGNRLVFFSVFDTFSCHCWSSVHHVPLSADLRRGNFSPVFLLLTRQCSCFQLIRSLHMSLKTKFVCLLPSGCDFFPCVSSAVLLHWTFCHLHDESRTPDFCRFCSGSQSCANYPTFTVMQSSVTTRN